MNCRSVMKHIQAYRDQTHSPALLNAIDIHMKECAACRSEWTSQNNLLSLLEKSTVPELSDTSWQVIHAAIMNELPAIDRSRKTAQVFSYFRNIYSFATPKAIAALLVFVLVPVTVFLAFHTDLPIVATHFNRGMYPHIASIDGAVYSSEQQPLTCDFSITPGKSIHTDNKSSVAIQVDKKTELNLGKSSECSVRRFSRKEAVFSLSKGDLRAQVSKRKPNQLFRIETPNAFCEVIGTRFDVTALSDPANGKPITTLVVHEGTVKFGSLQKNVFVKSGHAIALLGDSLSDEVTSDDALISLIRNNPGKGKFVVTSEPSGAAVFIDNVKEGKTPFATTLSGGKHSVRLVKNNFAVWNDSVDIHVFSTINRSVTLTHRNQNVVNGSIVSTPSAAESIFDNPLFQSAVDCMSKGDYKQAAGLLNQLIAATKITRLKAAAYQKLSICYTNMDENEKALDALNSIVDGAFSTDYRATALFERATLFRTSFHDAQKAINDLERYIKEFPSGIWNEEAMLLLAQLQQLTGSYRKAAATFSDFCTFYPKNVQHEKALYSLGTICYANLSDYNGALAAFNQLLHENPNGEFSEDASFWSADCQFRLGKTQNALQTFKQYQASYPNGKWVKETKTRLHTIETAEAR